MNKQRAHMILDQVRLGIFHSQSDIIWALTVTGDLTGAL